MYLAWERVILRVRSSITSRSIISPVLLYSTQHLSQVATLTVPECTAQDADHIDYITDPKQAEGKQVQKSHPKLSHVKIVRSKHSEEKAENKCRRFAFE